MGKGGETLIVLVLCYGFAVALGKVSLIPLMSPACMKPLVPLCLADMNPALGHYHIVGIPIIEVHVYA